MMLVVLTVMMTVMVVMMMMMILIGNDTEVNPTVTVLIKMTAIMITIVKWLEK